MARLPEGFQESSQSFRKQQASRQRISDTELVNAALVVPIGLLASGCMCVVYYIG